MSYQTYQPTTDEGRQVQNLLAMCDMDAETAIIGDRHTPCRHHSGLATAMVIHADTLGKAWQKIDTIAKNQQEENIEIALLKQEARREARLWGALAAVAVSVAGTVLANAIIYWIISKGD